MLLDHMTEQRAENLQLEPDSYDEAKQEIAFSRKKILEFNQKIADVEKEMKDSPDNMTALKKYRRMISKDRDWHACRIKFLKDWVLYNSPPAQEHVLNLLRCLTFIVDSAAYQKLITLDEHQKGKLIQAKTLIQSTD